MVGRETDRLGEGGLRFAALTQCGTRPGLPGKRFDSPRLERRSLFEAFEGFGRTRVIQWVLAVREPRIRVVPPKGDRAVVVLDRRSPTAFPLEELALPEENRRVLGVLPQRASELCLSRVRISKVDERVAQTEDRSRVVWSDLEDRLKQPDGLARVSVSPELLGLRNDIARLRRLEPERIAQRVDRNRETAESEKQVRALVRRPSVPSIDIEDSRITLESLLRAIEQDQDLGSVEPDARLLRSGAEEAVVALQGSVVVALLDERLGLLPDSGRSSFIFEFAGCEFESNRPRERVGHPFALGEGLLVRGGQRGNVRERRRNDVRLGRRHARDSPQEPQDLAPGRVFLQGDEPFRRGSRAGLDLFFLRCDGPFSGEEELLFGDQILRAGSNEGFGVRSLFLQRPTGLFEFRLLPIHDGRLLRFGSGLRFRLRHRTGSRLRKREGRLRTRDGLGRDPRSRG